MLPVTRRFPPAFSRPARKLSAHFSSSSCSPSADRRLTGPLPAYGAVGVARILESPSTPTESTLFTKEFSLTDRIALVTGANRGIGLETALTLAEAGARTVYCVDFQKEPGEDWTKVHSFVERLGRGKLEYINQDVTDQEGMWKVGELIGRREGRLDVCVAGAGTTTGGDVSGLEHPSEQFQRVMSVNTNGVLFTAQAAGQQMMQFKNGGSIILIASVLGSVSMEIREEPNVRDAAYHSSKGAVLSMTRTLACELGPHRIRVNSLSPGFIQTSMTSFLEIPELGKRLSERAPLGRIGRPDELRGVVAWLASDASSFCTGSDIIVSGGLHAW
ncbi:sorbose reductase sou1 [Dichomitus squalens]|uniref:Sorbose reductase sou1 n=1 Tax=Dichomitus squalens TaxID=114155 RepID=A0A4Q9PRX9_9APHY|nr:sorbose reductase sou1 [Dichomitus squalens]